jgi:prepilin-type processing-associated H-X9-DG protein
MANTTALNTRLGCFLCPSENSPFRFEFPAAHPFFGVEPGPNNYMASLGSGLHPIPDPAVPPPDGLFYNSSSIQMRDILDGASYTAMFSETITGTGGDPTSRSVDLRRDTLLSPTGWTSTTVELFRQECAAYTPTSVPATLCSQRANTWLEGAPFRTLYNHVVTPNPDHADCGLQGDIWLGGIFAARSQHPGGVHLLLADGSVRFVSNTVALDVWRALGTRNRQERLSGGSY